MDGSVSLDVVLVEGVVVVFGLEMAAAEVWEVEIKASVPIESLLYICECSKIDVEGY